MKMRLLVLGGTRFFGKQAVRAMVEKGYDVTIATRGQKGDDFGESIKRITINRFDAASLKEKLQGHYYDVVFDNLCYAPNDVKHLMEAMEGGMGKYIVTSSLAVYDKGIGHKEESFNPYAYPITYGERTDFSYAEGKRLVEAVCYQEYKHIPTIAVRFPVVIGKHDYTKRLYFYVEQIAKGKNFDAPGRAEPMSFITEEEAAEFLMLLIESSYVGPINGASHGEITVEKIIQMIESQAGKKACIDKKSEVYGPYSTFGNVTLDCTKAIGLGMRFRGVQEAFEEIINYDLDNFLN